MSDRLGAGRAVSILSDRVGSGGVGSDRIRLDPIGSSRVGPCVGRSNRIVSDRVGRIVSHPGHIGSCWAPPLRNSVDLFVVF